MVIPTPYQHETELDCREKCQLDFKEPWRGLSQFSVCLGMPLKT